jgi:hypothetical protein
MLYDVTFNRNSFTAFRSVLIFMTIHIKAMGPKVETAVLYSEVLDLKS